MHISRLMREPFCAWIRLFMSTSMLGSGRKFGISPRARYTHGPRSTVHGRENEIGVAAICEPGPGTARTTETQAKPKSGAKRKWRLDFYSCTLRVW